MNRELALDFDVQVITKDFLKALNFCIPIVERKITDPILNNIKLTHNSSNGINYLELIATDGDIFIRQQLPTKTSQKEISITLPLYSLSEIVRKIPSNEFTLTCKQDGQIVQIKGSQHLEFNISTLLPHQFPIIEELVDPDFTINITATKLAKMIEYTKFSMSTEETRYNLNGIYLHSSDGKSLSAASTDGHRLASTSCGIDHFENHTSSANNFGVILPRKTIVELFKIFKESAISPYNVIIKIKSHKIQFNCQNITIISKLIDGNFPEYEAFIPTNYNYKVVINSHFLAESIDRVSTITIEKSRIIILELAQQAITIYAQGAANSQAKELIPRNKDLDEVDDNQHSVSETYKYVGKDQLKIAFNAKYLLDILAVCSNSKIPITFQDVSSPAVIEILDDEISAKFVVMPVSVPLTTK